MSAEEEVRRRTVSVEQVKGFLDLLLLLLSELLLLAATAAETCFQIEKTHPCYGMLKYVES